MRISPSRPDARISPALAVTSLERNGALKEVPTVAESGYPGFEALMWYGVVARAAAPKGAIDRLSADITRAVRLPEVSDALERKGLAVATLMPAEFDAFIRAEIRSNGRIIREINLKVE